MEQGYLCLVLHAHLPFIRHPEYDDFLEEDWFFEAATETYIPFLDMFERLISEGIDFRITMSLTPTLCAMFSDELLMSRYNRHLNKLIELSEKEVFRTQHQHQFHKTALMYERKLKRCKYIIEKHGGNLINGFRKVQDEGKLEIITCCATHGFLPLKIHRNAVRAQIKTAVDDYKDKFNRKPKGIWLAECAYNPGDDYVLKEQKIRYFFLDTHGILYGTPRPKYGVFAPVYCPSGVAAFGRDMETAHQVWSADIGYPGDPNYREFYRDVGYDLDYDYIKPHLHSDGVRRNVGIKYYRITGKVGLNDKQPYNPQWALDKAASHAGNFMFNREQQIKHLHGYISKEPLIVSMYNAELYGHWWYEGPDFINYLFRKIFYDQKTIVPITPSEYLEKFPKNQVISPAASSWGDKGYYEVWLNGTNDWIYRHLHKASERMAELARENPSPDGVRRRALNQAARDLLLAQSSDWAFIMTTRTMVEYAEKRTRDHLLNFNNLFEQVKRSQVDERYVHELENKNNIFPLIDYTVFAAEAR